MFEDMELASESQIGIVTTMFGIGALITSIFSGILSDRTGSRKLLLVIGAIGYSACGIMLYFAHKLWHILLYRLLNGLASGCVYPIAIATVVAVGSLLATLLAFGIKEPLSVHARMLEKREISVLRKEISIDDSESSSLSVNSDAEDFKNTKNSMPLWKLIFQWQVLSASITTLSMGMLVGSLESVLPLYSKDKFGASASKIGLLFVLNGSVAILLSAPIGWVINRLISRHKEKMRMYIVLTGLALTGVAVLILGFGTSFAMILAFEALLSASILVVNIPVMSSFGDFVNGLGLNSMAQCYGIYNLFWALSSTIAPPAATFLYTQIGYRSTVSGLLTGLCVICALLALGEPIKRIYQSLTRTSDISRNGHLSVEEEE
ncbi:hypothetical protein LPJ53_001588 [Coemansia erecta]|uniref:MFS general substrate transporter n=1 Tax=Coemansia erecta TaxID=147472 RepID=A0A9W7Y631_9FUNG|nr:hypothetical protein LPJ53_001588 [Coemansia erecta]